jgi:hypothetical protein
VGPARGERTPSGVVCARRRSGHDVNLVCNAKVRAVEEFVELVPLRSVADFLERDEIGSDSAQFPSEKSETSRTAFNVLDVDGDDACVWRTAPLRRPLSWMRVEDTATAWDDLAAPLLEIARGPEDELRANQVCRNTGRERPPPRSSGSRVPVADIWNRFQPDPRGRTATIPQRRAPCVYRAGPQVGRTIDPCRGKALGRKGRFAGWM